LRSFFRSFEAKGLRRDTLFVERFGQSLPHERSECFGYSYSYLTKMGQNGFSAVDFLSSDRLLDSFALGLDRFGEFTQQHFRILPTDTGIGNALAVS
jgi:hypothetical protein